MIEFLALETDSGTRLDVFLANKLSEYSRSVIKKLCDSGDVLVNKELQKTKYKVRIGDHIAVMIDLKSLQEIPDISLDIIFEDADCLVINKPAGVLTHSKGAFNPEGTVATFIHSKTERMGGDRSGIVHRLDRATSGVIICAKNPETLAWFQKQFSQRKVKKTYYAVVLGHMNPQEAVIDIPIERHPRNPKTFRASPSGKTAQTHYKVVGTSADYQLLELKPTTGRTHQLRVHLKYLKHPILGDTIYGGQSADRMYLHASELELTLPNKQRKTFHVDVPESFQAIIDNNGTPTSPAN